MFRLTKFLVLTYFNNLATTYEWQLDTNEFDFTQNDLNLNSNLTLLILGSQSNKLKSKADYSDFYSLQTVVAYLGFWYCGCWVFIRFLFSTRNFFPKELKCPKIAGASTRAKYAPAVPISLLMHICDDWTAMQPLVFVNVGLCVHLIHLSVFCL